MPAPYTAPSKDSQSYDDDITRANETYPEVAVLLPVSKATSDTVRNWSRQLKMWYPTTVNFLFVCATDSGSVAAAIRALVSALKLPETRCVRIIGAGQATQCSQKNLKCVAAL
jgi:hypothetical protein